MKLFFLVPRIEVMSRILRKKQQSTRGQKMSKYLNVTTLITALIASAIFMFAYNKVAPVRRILGGQ